MTMTYGRWAARASAVDSWYRRGSDCARVEISTLAQSDPRLYQLSTADARAAHRPYVIVIDSARFKVSPACGRALSMIRYLIDRWPDVTFIHREPFPYRQI